MGWDEAGWGCKKKRWGLQKKKGVAAHAGMPHNHIINNTKTNNQ